MDLAGPCGTDHAHDLTARGAANDGVVNQHDFLSLKHAAHRVELELHAKIANLLLRLNEGAAHVMVANKPKTEWDAALRGKAHGRADAGIRHRHYDVSLDWRFACQLPA